MKIAFTSVLYGFIFALFLFPSAAFAEQGRIPAARQYGLGAPFQIADLPPGQLRSALESLPAAARSRAMERLHSFSFPHQDIDYLRADQDGGIYYADPAGADLEAESAPLPGEAAPVLTFDPGRAFLLHSHPGSLRKVFLNFVGGVVSGTAWSSNSLQALPYDTDGNPEIFSEAERKVIADIWHRVAEDFAPFDIDVTTERPVTFGPLVGQVMITKIPMPTGFPCPPRGPAGSRM